MLPATPRGTPSTTALAVVICGVVLLVGCESSQPAAGRQHAAPPLSPVLERMKKAYPDLASGRFVSLADFESPGQELLFRCVGPDGTEGTRPQPTLSILRSRNETGAGGLKARLSHPGESLRFDGRRSATLALIRDWRAYSLLLVSVYGPPDGLLVELSIESGPGTPLRWSRTSRITPGWNLLRIDVAGVGDHIDLADVRAITWRAPQLATPVELYLDDIILGDNTRYVLGADAPPGEMYVFTRGRRVHVGARQRFELAFADGLIVGWRDGGDQNLADTGGLGPWPVPLPEDWAASQEAIAYDDPNLFADWGPLAVTTQQVLEATPFRVLVEGRWRLSDDAEQAAADPSELQARPGHTWQYTIYPSGQVYVRVSSSALPAEWSAPRVGYALGLDARRGFQRVAAPTNGARFVLLARPGAERADLLWTWPAGLSLEQQREQVSADGRRLAVVVGAVPAAASVQTTHLLRIWPADIDGVPEASGLAADYQHPATVKVMTGGLITDLAGDLNHDGYNESQGCHELEAVDGVVRFTFHPGAYLRFDPMFRVHGAAGRRCWVYACGRLLDTVGRDATGELLVRLGHVVSTPLTVEVHTAPGGA